MTPIKRRNRNFLRRKRQRHFFRWRNKAVAITISRPKKYTPKEVCELVKKRQIAWLTSTKLNVLKATQ